MPQPTHSRLTIQREPPDGPEVVALLSAADKRSEALYPEDARHGASVSALCSANVRFFVARQDGRALGCGGYVLLGKYGAEMKRLFVDPASRARGVGHALVCAIEAAAAREGLEALFLETGIKSHEALRLYRRLGFQACPPFADYTTDPLSVFMTKRLLTS